MCTYRARGDNGSNATTEHVSSKPKGQLTQDNTSDLGVVDGIGEIGGAFEIGALRVPAWNL